MASSGRGLSFGNKILVMVLVCSVGLTSLTSLIALREYVGSYTRFIDMYRASLFSDFDTQARSEVETAVSLLQGVYEQQQKGELSPEEARKLGANLLRGLRYGKEGYFWADTVDGINVVLLGKPSEGTSRIDLQDKKGKYLIREIIEKGKQPGGGFTDYWFPKQGETPPSPKRGYSPPMRKTCGLNLSNTL